MFDLRIFSGRERSDRARTILRLVTPSKVYKQPLQPPDEVYQCDECKKWSNIGEMWETDLCAKCHEKGREKAKPVEVAVVVKPATHQFKAGDKVRVKPCASDCPLLREFIGKESDIVSEYNKFGDIGWLLKDMKGVWFCPEHLEPVSEIEESEPQEEDGWKRDRTYWKRQGSDFMINQVLGGWYAIKVDSLGDVIQPNINFHRDGVWRKYDCSNPHLFNSWKLLREAMRKAK